MAEVPWKTEPADAAPSFTRIAPYYDDLMQDVPYAIWLEFILSLAARHDARPRRILDLACGTGTVSQMLAVRGYEVVGIDGSEPMLEQARRKASLCRAPLEFLQGDLRDFEAPGHFDLVICLYDSLNNILEPEGVQQAFDAVQRSLVPGGLFIFDVNTEYAFRANLFTQENTREQTRVQY
ncbi:MAG: class I SAM-dependent methyltransferase, partial [Chloroflexi bacterium]|nr:class I SAM-dependent methyltransferase [Chloroflexota bacterium]